MTDQEKFLKSIEFSLKWEGGKNFSVVNGRPVVKGAAKNDAGGATAYGITWATLKAAHKQGLTAHDNICDLTLDEAKKIYKANYWDKYNWGKLEWPACLCCLDCCINHGGFASILQRAANDCGRSVVVDGKMGPKTFAALCECDARELAGAIYRERVKYYEKIIARNPSQEVFRKGWMRRAEGMREAGGLTN